MEKKKREPIEPSNIIYISNLNTKIKSQQMIRTLRAAFQVYGDILDIVCLKSKRLQGQAWVVFEEYGSAWNAKRDAEHIFLFDKTAHVSSSKLDRPAIDTMKKRHLANNRNIADERRKKLASKPRKLPPRLQTLKANFQKTDQMSPVEAVSLILLVNGLPTSFTTEQLKLLLSEFDGLKEICYLANGTALMVYGSATDSMRVKNLMDGFKVTPNDILSITFISQA